MMPTLYALWLPITGFIELVASMENNDDFSNLKDYSNSNWSWLTCTHGKLSLTLDSLGFIYLDEVQAEEEFEKALSSIISILNTKSKINITSTFLNSNIGYPIKLDSENENEELLKFLKKTTTTFNSIADNLAFEQINSKLFLKDDVFLEESKVKFSLKKSDEAFHTILNRNFENLFKKSIYFTHGLDFENGELYNFSIMNNLYEKLQEKLPTLELKINNECQEAKKDELYQQIIKKVVQDTIEERVVLNFLKITKTHYLNMVIDAITNNNEILKKLNSYLLEDIKKDDKASVIKMKDLDDEAATEIFIQNLLQVTPKFYMMDTKVQEAYYIKVGNTTTNLNINKNETILNTFHYRKWKSSINFFIETATKAKESLAMYHQNKTLKELEDIGYNANYQADIEDIRELQKKKALSLDGESKKILLFIAVVTLAGEAPLLEFPEVKDVLETMTNNAIKIIFNFTLYATLLGLILWKIKNKKSVKKSFKNFCSKSIDKMKKKKENVPTYSHSFEESDYDKHEHRSSRSLYSYDKANEKYEKIFINYNNLVSAYTLVDKLKQVALTQKTSIGIFKFDLFPKLLRDVPIEDDKQHVYRENYRISGNDRVATKIMYRYKLSDLKLTELLKHIQEDDFMQEYGKYLTNQSCKKFSMDDAIERLQPHSDFKEESKVTLYIVYSFVLKFYDIDDKNENVYNYTISKDQFRVHYHINTLDFKDKKDFEQKQVDLAMLIDIYFLKRLKRFKEVEGSQ